MEDRTSLQPAPVRVYVAAGSNDIDRAERFIKNLAGLMRREGEGVGPVFHITHDWTADVRAAIARGVPEHELPGDSRFRSAAADVEGVLTAEAFILLVPRGSFGAGFEFALACTRPELFVVCVGGLGSIFTEYSDARYPSDDQALIALPHFARVIRTAPPSVQSAGKSPRRARLFAP